MTRKLRNIARSNSRSSLGQTAEVSGHLGELLQGRLGTHGPVVLITLPMQRAAVKVSLVSDAGFGVHFAGGARSVRAAQIARLVKGLTGTSARGRWVVQSLIPPGTGSGTSTATLLGIARLLGEGGADRLAKHIVAVEGASDPLMYSSGERLLWASRQGQIVGTLPPLPRLEIVAGLHGAATWTNPEDQSFANISDLIAPWCAACTAGNRQEIGRLTSLSALRNIALRGGEPVQPLLDIGQKNGALGVSIAHTGSVRTLLFAPGSGNREQAAKDMHEIGIRRIIRFFAGG